MTVNNRNLFSNENRGASVLEVLLAMAIVSLATPFVYTQIAKTNHNIHDIAVARRIIETRDAVLNFVRMNQSQWPDVAQIRLAEDELAQISPDAVAGMIDKYAVSGAYVTDVYLAFSVADNLVRTNNIARHIGSDAAVIGPDGAAYGNSWAVAAPDFVSGDLIYRVSRDVSGEDTAKFLHRATSGEDDLNVMQRDLDMAHHHVYNVATLDAESVRAKRGNATFVDAGLITADTVYFSSGANLDAQDVSFGNLRVSGDINGFKNVVSNNINGHGYTTTGRIITDRARITGAINVASDLVLKSDTSQTISGFTGVSVNSVVAPFISAEEMIFYDSFGLTVSGELLMSTTSPVRLGNWVFPSTKPPEFSRLTLSRTSRPAMPLRNEFNALMRSGWRQTPPSSTPAILTGDK